MLTISAADDLRQLQRNRLTVLPVTFKETQRAKNNRKQSRGTKGAPTNGNSFEAKTKSELIFKERGDSDDCTAHFKCVKYESSVKMESMKIGV